MAKKPNKINLQYFLFFIVLSILLYIVYKFYKKYSFQYKIFVTKPIISSDYTEEQEGVSKNTYTWIIHMYPPEHNAGAEWMAHSINTYLVREKGAKVNVILPKTSVTQYERVRCIPIKDSSSVDRSISDAKVLISHLDMEVKAVKTAALTEKPLVLVMHNSFRKEYLKEFIKYLPNNLYLIHNSKWIQKYYSEFRLPSVVLYPPVNWKDYSVTSSREYVSLINMNENKGGKVFLEIVRQMPDVKFLGVKGAYDKQYSDEYPNLTLIGNTPQIKEVYSKTDILLMPSKYESWGRTAVEAMSSGIPVIAHPTPGLQESCGDAGIFCDRETISEWVKEIRKLKTDEAYYKMKSEACLKRAKELDPEPQLEEVSEWLKGIEWKQSE
jgi:glycosyltransferase involved in cell wall biosynthesis